MPSLTGQSFNRVPIVCLFRELERVLAAHLHIIVQIQTTVTSHRMVQIQTNVTSHRMVQIQTNVTSHRMVQIQTNATSQNGADTD